MFENAGTAIIGRRTTAAAIVERINLTVFEEDECIAISVVYLLAGCDENDGLPLILARAPGPLRLRSVEGIGVRTSSTRNTAIAHASAAEGWDHSSIAMSFEWPADQGESRRRCIVVPESIPAPVPSVRMASRAYPQPQIHVGQVMNSVKVRGAGIATWPRGRGGSEWDPLVQSVLMVPGAELSPNNDARIGSTIFSPAVVERLPVVQRTRIAARIGAYMHRLELLLGVNPDAHIAVVDRSDWTSGHQLPIGALVQGIDSLASDEPDVKAVAMAYGYLAGIWFGAGIRLHGKDAAELSDALRRAVALWGLAQEGFKAAGDSKLLRESRPLIGEFVDRLTPWATLREHLVRAWAPRIARMLSESDAARADLRALVSRSWATWAPANDFKHIFALPARP